jgi:hypothetical protein
LADLVGPTLDHHILVDAAGRRGRESAAAKDGLLGLIEQVPHKDGLELLGHTESEMLRRYVTIFNQDLSRAIQTIKLPSIGEPPPQNRPSVD